MNWKKSGDDAAHGGVSIGTGAQGGESEQEIDKLKAGQVVYRDNSSPGGDVISRDKNQPRPDKDPGAGSGGMNRSQ